MGASIQGRLWPRTEEERAAAIALGYDLDKVLHTNDLCSGDKVRLALPALSFLHAGDVHHLSHTRVCFLLCHDAIHF